MQAAQPVDLTAELAEVLRWREMEWSRIPPLSHKLLMPYLSAGGTINLDTAVTDKEDRKHLVKAYVGLRSAGLDGYAHYRVDGDGVCLGVRWAQKRSVDLRNFRLEYDGEKEDQDRVLYLLVLYQRKELATYFATRCDVIDTMFYGTPTLVLASEGGYLEIVQTLLGRGADVNMSSDDGDTALHLASMKGHIEVVRALLDAGAGTDVREGDLHGGTPISFACTGKHMEIFRALVEAGGDVDTPDSSGDTALHDASTFGFTEGVRYLVERGADVNMSTTNEIGHTPLHLASGEGHIEVVRALLEAGAGTDVRRVNGRGGTPISFACEGKHMEIFRALVEAGGDVDTPDSRGDTALHDASKYGFTEGVRYLVERGADMNESNGVGMSPLYYALKVETWHTEQQRQAMAQIAVLLREAGAQEPQPHALENLEESEDEEDDEDDY